MWIALEIVAVLEGARLTFVDIYRHQARRGFPANNAPFATGREPRATKAAQARVLHLGDRCLNIALACDDLFQCLVAAVGEIGAQIHVGDVRHGRSCFQLYGLDDVCFGRVAKRILANADGWRFRAATDARRGDDTHVLAENGGEFLD